MKESIAQAFIVNLILVFFVILILLFFGSINYSKAYKAKNRIINIIEKYGTWGSDVEEEVARNLAEGGYSTIAINGDDNKCNEYLRLENNNNMEAVVFPSGNDPGRRYDYCVIRHNSSKGYYYQVITHMKFEIPVIGGFLEFPVKGETKVLFENMYQTSSNSNSDSN